jgi:hypothetical protein
MLLQLSISGIPQVSEMQQALHSFETELAHHDAPSRYMHISSGLTFEWQAG